MDNLQFKVKFDKDVDVDIFESMLKNLECCMYIVPTLSTSGKKRLIVATDANVLKIGKNGIVAFDEIVVSGEEKARLVNVGTLRFVNKVIDEHVFDILKTRKLSENRMLFVKKNGTMQYSLKSGGCYCVKEAPCLAHILTN